MMSPSDISTCRLLTIGGQICLLVTYLLSIVIPSTGQDMSPR